MAKLDVLSKNSGGDSASYSLSVDSGSKVTFMQTVSPVGWTKDTTHNDKALRVVSGTASNGGADSFTSVFGSGKTTASHTLSTPQIPSHRHIYNSPDINNNAPSWPSVIPGGYFNTPTGGRGGSQAHSHSLSLDIQYVDVIIATKDGV